MPEDGSNEVIDQGDEGIVSSEEEPNADLPRCVRLNPKKAGMFNDVERSGMYLSQFTNGTDYEGNPTKLWDWVPKNKDCSGIRQALAVNILVPCNPKAESKLVDQPVTSNGMDEFMSKDVRELISIANTISEVNFIQSMLTYEIKKPKKERRNTLIASLKERINSPDVSGVTGVTSERVLIRDTASGRMVPDDITVT